MDPKIGIYICKGCEIGGSIDIDQLIKESEAGKLPICKTHDCLCSKEAVEIIKQDIAAESLNRIVVAACSNRVFPELFDFGKEVLTDRVNLREHVVWSHKPNDEDTQMLAEDYVRMGIARAKHCELPEPHIEETSKDIMVVGGGMTGMTAALAAADAGYKVFLIEKAPKLGGWATKFRKVFPKHPPYQDLEDTGVAGLIEKVNGHQNITVHTATTIKKTKGQPGKFEVTLTGNGQETNFLIGSIIQATGWVPYEPRKLGKWGYGVSPDVVTNIQVEEMANNGGIKRLSDGKPIDSIAFLQCAGSRDQEHLPYCSAVCCRVSLKQAMYVREQYPDAKIYIIYKDVRSPQQYEMFYAHAQKDDGLFLT
ncbi:MAG: FAD-dependent oxidoreductase, partial [Candidatus Zixiibacteriota bacterium]